MSVSELFVFTQYLSLSTSSRLFVLAAARLVMVMVTCDNVTSSVNVCSAHPPPVPARNDGYSDLTNVTNWLIKLQHRMMQSVSYSHVRAINTEL